MTLETDARPLPRPGHTAGFSLLEMLASIAIITLLMSAVFAFIFQAQKRFQGNVVVSESNQSARAALEVMTQEIGQAGYNPNFTANKTCSDTGVTANADPQCITLNNITGINPGDYVSVDTGINNEIVQVVSTSAITGSPCTSANQIRGIFSTNHTVALGSTLPFPVVSYKMPYGGGILRATGTSSDRTLELFGDINQDGVIRYVVYSLSAMSPATTVCIPPATGTCPAAQTYTFYNLYRSITDVPYTNLPPPVGYTAPANSKASPMVEKVLYNTTNVAGPTGQPIFAYPNQVVIGVIPNQITSVGTIVITLSVAVNPTSLESRRVDWYTMATQIRPLNLAAAVAVNNAGGGKYLPLVPLSLPMTFPSNYY